MAKLPDLLPFPKSSSSLAAYHYDPNTRTLHTRFTSGDAVYRYDDVPAERVAVLLENQSPGAYFAAKIKGLYNGKKVAP